MLNEDVHTSYLNKELPGPSTKAQVPVLADPVFLNYSLCSQDLGGGSSLVATTAQVVELEGKSFEARYIPQIRLSTYCELRMHWAHLG